MTDDAAAPRDCRAADCTRAATSERPYCSLDCLLTDGLPGEYASVLIGARYGRSVWHIPDEPGSLDPRCGGCDGLEYRQRDPRALTRGLRPCRECNPFHEIDHSTADRSIYEAALEHGSGVSG